MTADLHDLLEDAVSDVEPRDRLTAIRSRTAARRTQSRWIWLAAGGAVAATAVVSAVFVTPGGDGTRPASEPTATTTPDWYAESSTPPATTAPPPTNPTRAVALYFVGDTPEGPRLYREFRQVPFDDEYRLDVENPTSFVGVLRALGTADDPDYRSEVDREGVVAATIVEGGLRVVLDSPPSALASQQIAYTLAAATAGRVPISVTSGSGGGGVEPDPAALADVSISDPVEGRAVAGAFTARGVANSPEGNVPWRIDDARGDVVLEGFATASGAYDRLYPWETEINVTDLEPGTYTFVASTDDPSGGTEGTGATSDTRTIVVE